MSITSHQITRYLDGVGETTIDFNYTPPMPGKRGSAVLDVLKASPVDDGAKHPYSPKDLRELAQEELNGAGYGYACLIASEERGEAE